MTSEKIIVNRIITPAQCKAARALLGWDQRTLSEKAMVGFSTVSDFERGSRTPIKNNMFAIINCLESAGIYFLGQSGVDYRP